MSNNLELRGTVHKIEETQTFESGFQKRTLVINNGEQYRPYIAIDFLKDRIDLLDKFKEGDSVTVSVNIGNDYYKDKLFNNINLSFPLISKLFYKKFLSFFVSIKGF